MIPVSNRTTIERAINFELKTYNEAFSAAEKALKENELTDIENGLNVAVLNELRYAGKHATRVSKYLLELQKTSPENIEECNNIALNAWKELLSAIGHAKRAEYDAFDASLMYYLIKCNEFTELFQSTNVERYIPEYTAHKKELIRIKNTIAQESRGSEDYFKHKKEQVARVADIYQKWDAKRSILIASLSRVQPPIQESKWNYPGHWPMFIFILIMLYSVSALWALWSSSST